MSVMASQITSLTIVLLNRLIRRRSKKTSKLRVIGLCAVNSPVTGDFLAQRASKAENVSIWWRHHDFVHSEAGFTKDDYLILVGAIDLGGEYDASKMQVRNVTKLILHDQYNTQTHKNDIALLKVEPLQMTDYVRAICIPNSKTAEGTAAVISGWGDTDPSPAGTQRCH